jgi:phage terminase large subunit GpA-like protein
MPGYYRFDVTPYLREIVDCMGVESPVREVSLMKGVQLAYTTDVLENTIGYAIDHVKSAPVMMVTADADLAKMRMESYITPDASALGARSFDQVDRRRQRAQDRQDSTKRSNGPAADF